MRMMLHGVVLWGVAGLTSYYAVLGEAHPYVVWLALLSVGVASYHLGEHVRGAMDAWRVVRAEGMYNGKGK